MTTDSLKLEYLKQTNKALKNALKACIICPRKCGVDRTAGKVGYCRAKFLPVVYSYSAHHGEEPPISGTKGSGTIFFSHCNMRCVYCQNYYFSQLDQGEEVSIERLAKIMLSLQKRGCHNINLVTPSHYVPQILLALEMAISSGLNIPIVFNTSGYDLVDTIRHLRGIVDIYLPDMRYSDDVMAKKYSDAIGYVKHNRESVAEMLSQVGNLAMDDAGVAVKGLIIRLLTLPQEVSGTIKTLKYINENFGTGVYLSLMSQYYPTFKSYDYKDISKGITGKEYRNIVDAAKDLGLNNGWIQDSPAGFDPKFLGTNIKRKTDV